ncbi:MAG: pseudaminic acid cytidylyltransferase [Bacteroidales bacterium]|nr:pseudaminic acid cytidylyltransferase [Clostridium sp.]MCM1203846.1 pseudaminic acid cytidylyltransferase [Bacteroidales bacterium]
MQGKQIAIITARGGSKRIPKKNIKEFCGKPIMAYSIEAAIDSQLFDEVMVSTDSEEIAEIARQYGANVPFMRSEKTADDYATTNDVLKEVFSEYKERGQDFDLAVCLYPTAPFVTAEKLRNAMELMEKENADAVTPVVRFSFPPQRAHVIREGGLEYQYPEYALTRSQDLEPIYHDCGQFYVMRVANVLGDVPAKRTLPLVMSELEVQDIDNEEDWKLAEIKYKMMREKRGK